MRRKKIELKDNYIITRGLKEWVLNNQLFNNLFLKKCEKFKINPKEVRFYSQQDEDKYIIQKILKEKIEDGVFLEIGACDGILYSNTKTLEDYFGFKGILIEPQETFYKKLIVNRNFCETYNYAVTNSQEQYIWFTGNDGEGGVIETFNGNIENRYKVPNKKMKDILATSKFKYIDIMIIDVEGGELSLLESIDFSFPIFCIFFEAHSDQQEKNKICGNFLKSKGFNFIVRQRGNEVWINPNYFRKHLFNIPDDLQ